MTTITAIQTKSSRGPAAFVLLSDSRLTELESKPPRVVSDTYRKTFYSNSVPYIVAFSGHNQPAEAAINRSLSCLEDWHSPAPSLLIEELGAVVEQTLNQSATKHDVSIVHATCDTRENKFLAEVISFYHENRTTVRRPIKFGQRQATANLAGLGTGFVQYVDLRDADYDQLQTRKRVGSLTVAEHVQKFDQFIAAGLDPCTGGHMQGVTLNLDGTAKPIAFRYANEFFLHGAPIKWSELQDNQAIELRSPRWDYLSHRHGGIRGKSNRGFLGKLD